MSTGGVDATSFAEPLLWRWAPEAVEQLIRAALTADRPLSDAVRAQLHVSLAYALMHQHRFQDARAAIGAALERHPGDEVALLCDAQLAFFTEEPWPVPWEKFEARWAVEFSGDRPVPRDRVWDGSPLDGRSILLAGEGGLGDQIQFVRFAESLKAAGASRVIVSVHPPLIPLLATVTGIDAIVPTRMPSNTLGVAVEYDVAIPMLSVPRYCGGSNVSEHHERPEPFASPLILSLSQDERLAHDGPVGGRDRPLVVRPFDKLGVVLSQVEGRHARDERYPGAYLHVPPESTAAARRRIEQKGARMNVGLCWRSGKAVRRLPLELFHRLADVRGIQLFALGESEIVQREIAGFPIVDFSGDIASTSAAIAALDLVITVDTMVAHLAGALGRPTWVLLHYLPDWRWSASGTSTPWYPSMRLFRQERRAWEPVIDRVAAALGEFTIYNSQFTT